MITLNVVANSIIGSIDNKTFSLPFNLSLWNKLEALSKKTEIADSIVEKQEFERSFSQVVEEAKEKAIPQTWLSGIVFDSMKGQYYLSFNQVVSQTPIPEIFMEKIQQSVNLGISHEPILKLWTRFLRNPRMRGSATSIKRDFSDRFANYVTALYVNPDKRAKLIEAGYNEKTAEERATIHQVGITQEGLLKTYKVSKEIHHKFDPKTGEKIDRYSATFDPDTGLKTVAKPTTNEIRLFEPAIMEERGDAFYCSGPNGFSNPEHFIRIGCLHYLSSWNQVDTNDHNSCVPGLHIGNLDYIRGFQTEATETHNVLCDPCDIGAIPDDCLGAIRTLRYYVLDAFTGVNGSIYHSSILAAHTDNWWKEQLSMIMENEKTSKTSQELTLQELKNL